MMARVRAVSLASISRRVDVAGVGLDVHEHRPGAQQHDGLDRGGEGEGRGDDLVAGLQVQRHHRDQQRLGAAGHGDAVLGAGEGGQGRFELLDLGAHDVLAVVQHTLDARVDAGFSAAYCDFRSVNCMV
jgi:hypothetical protein